MSLNKENNYLVINEAFDPKIIDFVYKYFLMKRRVAKHMFETKFISPFTEEWGYWGDDMVKNTYSHYADIVMETILQEARLVLEKKTKLKLIPTYSYARIYKHGDILKRHKDRPSCEVSATLNLGGDPWPIFLEPDSTKGKDTKDGYISEYTEGVKIVLKPGDALIYKGCDVEHWRDPFEGENCGQVFLHYNDASHKEATKNKYDGRPLLGLPSWYIR